MFTNRYSAGGWLLTLILLLNGCNGDNSTNNEKGEGGNNTPSVSLSAENVVLPAVTNHQAQVNLENKIRVRSAGSNPVEQDNYVLDVEPIDSRKACEQIQANSDGFSINVGDFVGVCGYKYDAASYAYPELSTQAYSLVVSQKQVNGPVAWFEPISRTTLVNLPISIDLGEELKDLIPSGYKLSKDVTLFGAGTVNVDTLNETITYTPTAGSEAGFARLIYSYDNGVNVMVGNITISLSEEANSAPNAPDIDYSTFGKPQVNVNEEVEIDLAPYVSDPDGDAVQLIDVKSWNAAVAPVAPDDMGNLAFKFSSMMVGEHIVSYVLSDHFGGYASGLVRIEVYDPAGAAPWGNIKMDGKLFWGPLTKSEADANGVQFTGTHYEKNTTVAISVFAQAQEQCKPLGRLPTSEEMRQLSLVHAGDIGGYNWPIELGYYAKNGSQVKIIDITDGNETTTNANGQYVTCVTEGGFVVDTSESVLNTIANGKEEAKVVAKVSAAGRPLPGVLVSAKASGEATLKNSEAKTDENGLATFSLVSVVSGKVDVTLSIKGVDASPSATVQFFADETTADLSLATDIDWQEADGGIDEIVATVTDSNNNPIPNLPINFSSIDTVDIKASSVQTDSNGEMRAQVTWNSPFTQKDVEATVQGKYVTSLNVPLMANTNVHFKGTNYEVVSAYQKVQGTIDTPAYVCALVIGNGEAASGVKIQWASKEEWALPITSETESNGLGEACTWFKLKDLSHHDELVEVTATVGSSEVATTISFLENRHRLISVELYEAGTETSPAKVVAHVVDENAEVVPGQIVNWSSSVNWVKMDDSTSTTDDKGNAYNQISIVDKDYLGKTLTIFGEIAGHSGSTSFMFRSSSDPAVTIANMKVLIPGNATLPTRICADVLGLETVEPDKTDGNEDPVYVVDWSATPDWVAVEAQTDVDVKGHACNSFYLKDPEKLYKPALATVKFRNLASSTLNFWFWDKELPLGKWKDETGRVYNQVAVDPSTWMLNDDKNSVCRSVGYSQAIDWHQDKRKLTPIAPAYWSDNYYATFTLNAFVYQINHKNAGLGQGSPKGVSKARISGIGGENMLQTFEEILWGNVCLWCQVKTKSDFIICI